MNYQAIANTADKLISKYGSEITCSRSSETRYDTFLSAQVSDDVTDYIVKGLVDSYSVSEVDNNLIQRGDVRLYLSPITEVEPLVSDTFIWDEKTYDIISVIKLRPASTTLIYECQGRENGQLPD